MIKKIMFIIVSVLMMGSIMQISPAEQISDDNTFEWLREEGVIAEKTATTIRLKNENDIILHVKDCLVLNDGYRRLLSLDHIKEGDRIVAFFSPAMTRSMPPQSSAYAIMANPNSRNEKVFSVSGQNAMHVLQDTTDISDLSGYKINIQDIKQNDQVLWWKNEYSPNADLALVIHVSEIPEYETPLETEEISNPAENRQTNWFIGNITGVTDNEIVTIQVTNGAQSGEETTINLSGVNKYEMTTGLAYSGAITQGQTVMIYFKNAEAETVFFNPDKEGAAAFKVTLGNKTMDNAEEITFQSDDGLYLLTVTNATEVMDSYGNAAIPAEGQNILVWCPFIASSYPGQARLTKAVVLIPQETIAPQQTIHVNSLGEVLYDDGPIASLNTEELRYFHETNMLPIRDTAEALGYTVGWEPDSTVILSRNNVMIVFNIGDKHFTINGNYTEADEAFGRLGNKAITPVHFINRLCEM